MVELLVVIAIIAVLASIVMPSLSRAKFLARVVTCGSGQRQFVVAGECYAGEERGFLPRVDTGESGRSGGNNIWDVHMDIYDRLHDGYGVPHEAFFCTFTDADHLGDDFLTVGWKRYGFALLTFSYWVPRRLNCGLGPPDLASPGTFVILDTKQFRGPTGLRDPLGSDNPVLTDAVITPPAVGPDADLTGDPSAHGSTFRLHLYRGVLGTTNNAFMDGSVRQVPAPDVRARFFGNWWNWR